MGSGHLAGSCGPGPGERKRETCIRNMSRKLLAALVGTSTTSLKTGRCWRRALSKRGGERGLKFIVQGGEKHAVTGHSFVAEASYAGRPRPGQHACRLLQHDLDRPNPDRSEAGGLAAPGAWHAAPPGRRS